jgi:hypothetical protein
MSAASVDEIVGLENRRGIFPIHRSTKFVLLSATTGTRTHAIRCRFGVSSLDELDDDSAAASRPAQRRPTAPVVVTRALIERMSGPDDLGLPELLTERDLRIVEALTASVPTLEDAHGWHARFGRELNATDDGAVMVPAARGLGGRPVVEGKVLTPFRVALAQCRFEVDPKVSLRRTIPSRPRLGYREVASATNRTTLIAAIVPARAVTTHTVFCLKGAMPLDSQRVLCGLLNSFVANYLVRMRVSTHVTSAIMSRLRLPFLTSDTPLFRRVLALSTTLLNGEDNVEVQPAYVELQALSAEAYALSVDDFSHVLGTFPLIPQATRDRCLTKFRRA